MQVEHTPPKRKVQFDFSTPPKDHSDQSTLVVKSNLKSSRKSNNKSVRSFSPTKTPYKSLKKSSIDSDDDNDKGRLESDFIFQKMLGRGNFSRVSLYKSKISGELFAIKQMSLSRMSQNELQALATISVFCENNQNLVRYYNSWTEGQNCYITMQYCNRSLDEEFEQHKNSGIRIPECYLVNWLKQILNGLAYIHQKNIVHLDIKPQNILFSKNQLKISDLGLCRLGRVNKWMELVQGDSRYLDKIILNYNQNIDLTKADICSLGLSFYEAITLQEMPTNGPQWHALRSGVNLKNRKDLLQQYSQSFLNIIEMMIRPDPIDRPSAHQILTQLNYNKNERSNKKSRVTEYETSYIPMLVEEDENEHQINDLNQPFQLIRRISRTPMISAHKLRQSKMRQNSL